MVADGLTKQQHHKSHRSHQAGASAKKKSKYDRKNVTGGGGSTEEDKKNQQQQNPKVFQFVCSCFLFIYLQFACSWVLLLCFRHLHLIQMWKQSGCKLGRQRKSRRGFICPPLIGPVESLRPMLLSSKDLLRSHI